MADTPETTDSALGRLPGVLISPGKTFRAIAARPTWGIALIVLILCGAAVGLLAAPRTDFEDIIRQTTAKSGREVPQEQLDKQIEFMQKARTPMMVAGAFVAPILYCLLALLPWVALKLLGSDLDYRQSLSVVVHSFMPAVVSALLSIPVILSRPSWGYEDLRDNSYLASSLAAVAGTPDTPAPLYALLASLDFFSLWTLFLLILGYREVGKVSTAKAATTMIVLWLVFVGVKVGWAALFS
jgi:hypothetical protein